MKSSISDLVFDYVKKIPRGSVLTYGLVAEGLRKESKSVNGHIVGWVLHKNKSLQVPCHRVVDRNGRLAPNFGPRLRSGQAFNGAKEQRRRLENEGVGFMDEMHVDMKKYLWLG